MSALAYHGANDVRVDTVPAPIIQDPDDIILGVTAIAICGSDLHLYRGKIPQTEDSHLYGGIRRASRLRSSAEANVGPFKVPTDSPWRKRPWAASSSTRNRTTAARSFWFPTQHPAPWAPITCKP